MRSTIDFVYDLATIFLSNHQRHRKPQYSIHALGQNYTVILNEITVIPKFSGTRLRRGYIGIQNHDSDVSFRKIRIKDLSE
jgi:3-keto-disaccharide hydrolase